MRHDSLLRNDEDTFKVCKDWQCISNEFFKAYQEQTLNEIDFTEKPLKISKLLREFKRREKEKDV